ncbi:MAG: integrase core domain-containing protein, partial [Eubacteriales bacterium]|nr:integrase core domain-containing protein [Eubacteriales bacterium]
QVLTQRWIRYYNQIRPHSSLGGRPPAPQTVVPNRCREFRVS